MTLTHFVHHCPKDPAENLRWRLKVRRAAVGDRGLQTALFDACMQDVLFWFGFAMWLFEPRGSVKTIPFCTWPHQDPVILGMDEAITRSERTREPVDVVVDKSRAQGATWMYLAVIVRRWIRDPLFSAGLVTRTETLVDGTNDPDTLMWKVDWMLKMLPAWFLPDGFNRSVSDHSISNPANGATIMGYSAAGDVGRGGRKSVFAIDELGAEGFIQGGKDYMVLDSTQHVTDCRIIPSTFGGDTGAFYDMTQDPGNATLLILDWKDNPTQNKLAYRMREGHIFAVRTEETAAVKTYVRDQAEKLRKIERRGHKLEGKFRSPWYDSQCLRPGATPRSIAKELDRNPKGITGKIFNQDVLDRMAAEKAKPPVWEGKVSLVDGSLRLLEQVDGPLRLWFKPGLDNEPPGGKYVLAADIATGIGSGTNSNSALVGASVRTGEQVLEYANNAISETRLARLACALCEWLNKAQLIWESQGPTGKRFEDEVVKEIMYPNIWLRPKELAKGLAKSNRPGWANNTTRDKINLFEDLWIAFDDGHFTPRSLDMLKECGGWEWDGKDIKYKGTGHGDRVISAGMAWKAMKSLGSGTLDKTVDDEETARYGTLAWRMKEFRVKARHSDDIGEEYGLVDLLTMR